MLHQVKSFKGKQANEAFVSWTLFILGAGVIALALVTAIVRTDAKTQEASSHQDETAEVYKQLFGEDLR